MAVTQQDIANKLKLSRSLVAGVLNNKAGVWASDETRQRIVEAARELNYRPHAAARALRSGKTQTIAFLDHRPSVYKTSHQIGDMIEGLADFVSNREYRLMIDVVSDHKRFLAQVNDIAISRSCDILILWGSEDSLTEGGELLEAHDVPFIVKGYFDESHPDWLQIDYDHMAMMRLSVERLASMGHRRLALFVHNSEQVYVTKLREGFRIAAREILGEFHPEDVVLVGYHAEIRERIDRWFALPVERQPTGFVVGTNDEVSWIDLELALARHGRRLDLNSTGVSAVGLRYTLSPMLFGRAYTFSGTRLDDLMRVACHELLSPLMNSREPRRRTIRFCPSLSQTKSLELHLDHSEGVR